MKAPEPAGDRRTVPDTPRHRYKRPFDLTLVTLALVLLGPLWLLLVPGIALAIRLEDGGPVLYRQRRLGAGGRVFTILKFRTMVPDAEAGTGPVWAREGDPRSTRLGRVLRRLHLDELPQIVNVLRGEMSLVGPRPERPELAARIERELPEFRERLRVRPGIAGLAQTMSDGSASPRHKLGYDNAYISRMSPWLDMALCARCVARILLPVRRTSRPRGPVARSAPTATPPRSGGVTASPAPETVAVPRRRRLRTTATDPCDTTPGILR